MMDRIDTLLARLAELISQGRHESLETDTVEIKPVPADHASWKEQYRSINAFLNTRGGVLILGIREETTAAGNRYVFSGYRPDAEPKIKEFSQLFTNHSGQPLDLKEYFPPPRIVPFPGGHVAVVHVDKLPDDQKFAFYQTQAWKRVLTGDHRITAGEIEAQEEYRAELWQSRELQTVPDSTEDDIDLDPLNDYIQQLNRPVKIETIKADLVSARPFLLRKHFLRDGEVTLLGMLVCGRHVADKLGFRCHVHGYVDVPQEIARDKQDLVGNVLPVMQASLAYILRNIQVGISSAAGGTSTPQYPEEVLRETVNNALAHRDYSIDKQAFIIIKPGQHVAIRNPGRFRPHLLIEDTEHAIPVRRIIPDAKARNPKLADVLRVYRKWEGQGIGMATLVNLCLEDRIDLPTYRLHNEEVCLYLNAGRLLDERIETRLEGFERHIEDKLGGPPSREHKLILAYLMKSEWSNTLHHHTILLTADNNHFEQLVALERAGLIVKHPCRPALHPVYVADRVLMRDEYRRELEDHFGSAFATLNPLARDCLRQVYRHAHYGKSAAVTAKTAAFSLWAEKQGTRQDIKAFDAFYRQVRYAFNKLKTGGFLVETTGPGRGMELNPEFRRNQLL